MKKKPLKKGDLVVVYWVDITSNDGWNSVQVVEEYQPFEMASVGWWINDQDGVIRLASTVCQNDGTSNVLVIPQAVVRDIRPAKYERKK